MSQVTIPDAMQRAVQYHQAGRLADAEQIYRQVLAAYPDFPDALYLLGTLAQQCGRHAPALPLLRRAVAINPQIATWHVSLGVALALTGSVDDAVAQFEEALKLDPKLPEAHLNLGNTLQLKGRHDQATRCFRTAIELKPDYAEAHFNLANALRQTAVEESIEEYRKVTALRPDLPLPHAQAAELLHQNKRHGEAIAAYRRAILLQPNVADPHYNLGVVLAEAGRCGEAIEEYREAIRIQPNHLSAHFNLAVALGEGAPVEELLREFGEVLRIDPNQRVAFDHVLHLLHYQPEADPQAVFQSHREWARRFEQPLERERMKLDFDRNPRRRLRIGYVSRDFRDHSVAYFIEPLLRAHDRQQFEVFCYADEVIPGGDQTTARLRGLADVWRETTNLSDAQLADQVRGDEIDILVDLAGHTDGNRLLTFARKPAALQVTYLGYPDTTGMRSIDYRVTDGHADPIGDPSERLHSEQLLRLFACAWCYQPPDDAPDVTDPPSEKSGIITFGSFNAVAKLNDPHIALWARILSEIPRSRLVLKARCLDQRDVQQRIIDPFRKHSIDAKRIEFLGALPSRAAHLTTYGRIDVALDTSPYNGVATTCEALWMGVPVISLAGRTHASRIGASLLRTVGLPELVVSDADAYVEAATTLASDATRRNQLRRTLRQMMRRSALLDGQLFASSLEQSLRAAWQALTIDNRR